MTSPTEAAAHRARPLPPPVARPRGTSDVTAGVLPALRMPSVSVFRERADTMPVTFPEPDMSAPAVRMPSPHTTLEAAVAEAHVTFSDAALGRGAKLYAGPPPPADITLVQAQAQAKPRPNSPIEPGIVEPAFNPLARTNSATIVIPVSPFESFRSMFGSLRRGRKHHPDNLLANGTTAAMQNCQVRVVFDREWYVSGGVLTGWIEIETREDDDDPETKPAEVFFGDIYVAVLGVEEVRTKQGKKRRTFLDRRCLLQDRKHPTDAVLRSRPPDKDGYWRARRGKSAFPFAIPLYTGETEPDGWPRPLDLPSALDTRAGRITYTVSGVVQYRDETHRGTLSHHREVAIYEFVDPVDAVAMRSRVVTAQARKRLGWPVLESMGVGPGGVILGGSGGGPSVNVGASVGLGRSSTAEDEGDGELECAAAIERGLVAAGSIIYVRVLVRNDTKRKVSGLRLSLYRRAIRLDAAEMSRAEANVQSRSLVADASRTKLITHRVFRDADHRLNSGVVRECVLTLPVPSAMDLNAFTTARGAKLFRVGHLVQVSVTMKFSKDLNVELPISVMHPASWSDPPPPFESPLSGLPAHKGVGTVIGTGEPGATPGVMINARIPAANIPYAVPGAKPAPVVPSPVSASTASSVPHPTGAVSPPLEESKHILDNVLLQDRYYRGMAAAAAAAAVPVSDAAKSQTGAGPATSASAATAVATPAVIVGNADDLVPGAPPDVPLVIPLVHADGDALHRPETPVASIRQLGGLTQLRVMNPDASGMSTLSSTTSGLSGGNLSQVLLATSTAHLGAAKPVVATALVHSTLPAVMEAEEPAAATATSDLRAWQEAPHHAVFTDDTHSRAFFRAPTGYQDMQAIAMMDGVLSDVEEETDTASIASFDTGHTSTGAAGGAGGGGGGGGGEARGKLPPIPSDDEHDHRHGDDDIDDKHSGSGSGSGVVEFAYEPTPGAQSTVKSDPDTTVMGTLRRRIIQVLGKDKRKSSISSSRGIEAKAWIAQHDAGSRAAAT